MLCIFCQALREGTRCVTAHWLNTVLKKKRMVPPHRTLHLPFAFPPGAKPCSQHVGLLLTNCCLLCCYQICWVDVWTDCKKKQLCLIACQNIFVFRFEVPYFQSYNKIKLLNHIWGLRGTLIELYSHKTQTTLISSITLVRLNSFSCSDT